MDFSDPIELAYVGVEASDPAGLARVLEHVAGLIPGDVAGSWRNDDRAHRLLVTQGPADDASAAGFEVADADAAAAVAHRLTELGHHVEEASPEQCRQRRVAGMWQTTAPWGTPVEIVHGLQPAAEPFTSDRVPSGFKTAGIGFGHVVFMTPDIEAAHRFVVDGLGFRQTDWLDLRPAPDVVVTGRFYHGNPRHHTLALVAAPASKLLHHVMLETNRADDVGAAFDRAHTAGIPIASGLGKHDNDQMFSFYVETPAGFQIEIGHGAREVGPDWSENRAYDRISLWGHQPVLRPPAADLS
jgi:2,3-dihydroxybiphenyl 1,2-dioxygenase